MQLPIQNSGLAQALSMQTFEFVFTGAAIATNGSILTLVPAQKSAAAKVFVAIGLGDVSTAVMSTAVATAMVTPENYQSSQIPNYPITDTANLITGLVNYFDEIEANADGADSIGFCVQGLPIKQIVSIDFVIQDASTMNEDVICKSGGALILPEPVTLGAASEIIKTGTTEIDFDTDKLNLLLKNQLLFGSFTVAESDNVAPASGDLIILRIKAIV